VPLDPFSELLSNGLIFRLAGEFADDAAFLLGKQVTRRRISRDTGLSFLPRPGRVLHQGFLAGEVASIAFLYVQSQEKADQDQDADNEQGCVILHRIVASVCGNIIHRHGFFIAGCRWQSAEAGTSGYMVNRKPANAVVGYAGQAGDEGGIPGKWRLAYGISSV
jgi:hypothetical protein